VICTNCSTEHDRDGELCFRCHIRGIRFSFSGSAVKGRKGWNRTANEWKLEHFGTSDDKELAKRGIERAPS
jgi:hypothetical protein